MNRWLRFLITLIVEPFKKRIRYPEEHIISYRVWFTEADLSAMNASQVLMITEMARLSMVIRCGVFRKLIQYKWMPVMAASNIKFIKPIKRFQKFTVRSLMIGYDEKFWYMKHQLYNSKNELAAVILVKACYVCKAKVVPAVELLNLLNEPITSLPIPKYIQTYIEFEKQLMNDL
jgi:acyl-CoA thioesterase FadM